MYRDEGLRFLCLTHPTVANTCIDIWKVCGVDGCSQCWADSVTCIVSLPNED